VIFWRREPKFKKIVRPEESPEKIYCSVFTHREVHETGEAESRCREVVGWFPRLAGVLAIPHRGSKLVMVEDRPGVMGATYLLYPGTLRPGSCTDDRGNAGIAYFCVYPDYGEFTEKGGWRNRMKGKYFRLRDDVEEVWSYEDAVGHPVYIVRNKLGETFRMTGVYARIYEILRRKDEWIKGEDLLGEDEELLRKYMKNMDFVDTKSQEDIEELVAGFLETFFDAVDRIDDLMRKLTYGRVEELPPPGVIPADLERLLVKVESYETAFEMYSLFDLTKKLTKPGEEERDVFFRTLYNYTMLALGLLVYEALIVEMGIE
jgi:hypothetical protein